VALPRDISGRNKKKNITTIYRDDNNNEEKSNNFELINFYPYEAVYNLVQKHLLPSYLGQYGFNILPTKIVKSIDDIDIENFMLKHIIGAGAKDINFVADDLFYKKIRNKKELLDKNSIDDINAILAKGVVCQKYIDSYVDSPEKNVQVAILGFVNKHSEILFGRNTKIVFNKSSRTADTDLGTLPTREYNLYPDIQDKLIPLIREKNIKNAVFNLQLMGKENSTEWYPTDFNFRQAPYSIAFLLLNNKDEITRQWNHLFNMPNTLPDTYGTKEEYKNGIHWKHFMRYNHNDAVPTLLRKTISNV
jgi:hypothetical protein